MSQRAQLVQEARQSSSSGRQPAERNPERRKGTPPGQTSVNSAAGEATLQRMSRIFGLDFGDVRIHADGESARRASLPGARAWTNGEEIVFQRGAFQPGTREGDHIIAHELAHVAQARGGTGSGPPPAAQAAAPTAISLGGTPAPSAPQEADALSPLEAEAEEAARDALEGRRPRLRPASLGPAGACYPGEGGGAGTATSNPTIPLPPAGTWKRYTDGRTFVYVVNPGDLQGKCNATVAGWIYATYCQEIFGVDSEASGSATRHFGVHLSGEINLSTIPMDAGYRIRVTESLHQKSVAYFKALGIEAKINPEIERTGNTNGFQGGSGSGNGASPVGQNKAGGSRTRGQASDTSRDPPEIKKARALLRLLMGQFPEDFQEPPMLGVSEIDLLQFIAYEPDLFRGLPPIPSGAVQAANLTTYRAYLDRWKLFRQQHSQETQAPDQGDGDEERDPVHMIFPTGRIVVTPALDPTKGDKYIKGSTVNARMFWEDESAGWMNVFPHWATFDWKLIDESTKKIEDTPYFGAGIGKDEWSFDIPNKDGTFHLTLDIWSEHFLGGTFRPSPVVIPTISENQRQKQVFDSSFVGSDPSQPFTRDGRNKLHLKEGQSALSIDEEITMLDMQIGTINGFVTDGRLTQEEADGFIAYYNQEKTALVALKEKTSNKSAYFVRASYVSRESSTTIPTLRTYMMRDEANSTSGSNRSTANATYKVTLYDTTLDQTHVVQHPGEGVASVTSGGGGAARAKAEKMAIADMKGHFHDHNDYPAGTVHLAVQLMESAEVYETTIETDNWKKPAEKALAYIGMGAGVALILAAPFTGGGSVVAGLVLIGSVAGLGAAVLALNEQYAREGEIKADSRLALNLLTIATSLVGLSQVRTIAAGFQVAGQLSNGRILATAGFNLGAAGIQGFIVTQDLIHALGKLEAQYKPRLMGLTPGTEEYDTVEREYKSAVAQLMGAAAVNGAFTLVAIGQSAHALAQISVPGPLTRKTYKVQSEIADLSRQFIETGDPRLITEKLKSGVVTGDERVYLEEVLTKNKAKDPSQLPPEPEPLKRTPVSSNTNQEGESTATNQDTQENRTGNDSGDSNNTVPPENRSPAPPPTTNTSSEPTAVDPAATVESLPVTKTYSPSTQAAMKAGYPEPPPGHTYFKNGETYQLKRMKGWSGERQVVYRKPGGGWGFSDELSARALEVGYPEPPEGHYYVKDAEGFQLRARPEHGGPFKRVVKKPDGTYEFIDRPDRPATWAEAKKSAADQFKNPHANADLEAELTKRKTENGWTDDDIGLIRRWGDAITLLLKKGGSRAPTLDDLLAGLEQDFSRGKYDDFRHLLRSKIVETILGPSTGTATPPKEQMKLLDEFAAAMPEQASQGALFSEYRKARMTREAGTVVPRGGLKKSLEDPGKVLTRSRDADGFVEVQRNTRDGPKKGLYGADDKYGEHPLDREQVKDVSKLAESRGGLQADGNKLDGYIYFYEDEAAGRTAADYMDRNALSDKIHVACYGDANGALIWLR